MPNIARTAKLVLACGPAVLAIYLLFRLEQSGTWGPETAYRDAMTLGVLVTGMAVSFALLTATLRAGRRRDD